MQIGVDFGGTKIEVAALDGQGRFLARSRTPNPGEYDKAIDAICGLVAEVERGLECRGTVGVGAPGSISVASRTVRNANSVWLNGRNFREDLSAALARDIRIANDANCLALSEATDGATRGAAVAFAVILGTGCGGGVTVDGKLIEGANRIGGEWGHTPLPWLTAEELDGPECWCGRHGCLETWISGTGFARDFRQVSGRDLAAEDIIAAGLAGDREAAAAFDRYIDRLGRSLAMVCNIIDPEVIVLGGGMSNVPEIFDRTPEVVSRYVFSDEWRTRMVPAQWGDSSGVRGAARLWPAPGHP